MTDWLKTEEMAKQVVEHLSKFANAYDTKQDREAVVNLICDEHRTLQQGIGRLVFALIAAWAEDFDLGRFDARNHALCEAAARIRNHWAVRGECWPPGLPLI